ncbi:MAG TPA: ATPase [Firmicutes bacterium]|nr:ATPase [Bacillota bacterium]
MAVAKMKLVNIIGHVDFLDAVLIACGKTGVSQPDDALSFFSDTRDFSTPQEDNPYTEPLGRLESAISRACGELPAEEVLTAVNAELSPNTEKEPLFQYVERFSKQMADLTRQRGLLSVRCESLNKDCEQLEHFMGLDIDLDAVLACQTIKVRFGRLPRDSFEKLKIYNENPYVLFFPGASDASYYWGVYFAPIDLAPEVDRIFSSLYFERLRLPSGTGRPDEIVAGLKKEKQQVEQELASLDKQIADTWAEERDKCLRVYSLLKQLSYYFSARRYAARYNDKFILTGWVPTRDERRFRTALDAVDGIEYTIERADSDAHHAPPVKLCNAGIFKPFEFFVDMYGLPRYTEVDPTAFVAITYTLLFGIMFGDLGQGLVVAAVGWLMWKLKKMAIGKILVPCGICSALFGVVYGSVFGFEHALDPLYHALFGLEEKPIEVMNSTWAMNIILASVVIGLALIMLAMCLNIYSSLRRRDYESGVFGPNGIVGLVFYGSLVCGFGLQLLLNVKIVTLPYVLVLIVLPLVLMFLREPLGRLMARDPDWKPEKWGEFILQNFFEMFELMLSYLSNTMSFLRVGAFVLIHAGMMMAVFTLAELAGGVGYVAIVIFGNALVMCMEALLVAIQVLRLEFYEMFSRYYNGDGRPFKPLDPKSGEKVFTEVK